MRSNSETVDASTAGVSVSSITGNGDGTLVASAKLPDGHNAELSLAEAIKNDLGGFDAFKEAFGKAATTRFGSGWAWLSVALTFRCRPPGRRPLRW